MERDSTLHIKGQLKKKKKQAASKKNKKKNGKPNTIKSTLKGKRKPCSVLSLAKIAATPKKKKNRKAGKKKKEGSPC